MPELPDVEVFRRTLAHSSLHREITGVEVADPMVLEDVSAADLERELTGSQLTATTRHGKHLYVRRDAGPALALHFGMTAYLEPDAADAPEPDHARVTLLFEGDRRLVFVDQRRFGRITLVDDPARDVEERGLGPDALAIDRPGLHDRLEVSRGGLAATLMDQSVVAGIGNIYSDEVLFHARLDPRMRASTVTDREVARLHHQLRRVLERAIEAHARPEAMPAGWLIHAREDGAPCPRGNGTVRPYSVAGRTAYWCPECQGGD
ncbi:Fpg/Nei family DNA glycosylase [Nocardioides aquiterrae]|uniref:Formamidopyrimidine-DNA glycosylase n=1 Tax=Nocardioides aquiterrae TaxID=203799 RepID=A0ABN1UCJ3_9ACTN